MFAEKMLFSVNQIINMSSRCKKILFSLLLLCFGITGLYASDGKEIDTGATAWMLTSTALVLLMVPGLAMFYGGLVRTKNGLGTMMRSEKHTSELQSPRQLASR